MKMDQKRLEKLYPAMTDAFSMRMEQLIHSLPQQKEEVKVKRMAMRTVLIWAVLTVLLCATAYAVITYGLEWYYNNRFIAYQQNEPETYAAIMDHVQTALEQSVVGDDLIDIRVENASWVTEKNLVVVMLRAQAKNPDQYELHPMWNLDADGAYVSKEMVASMPFDSELRSEHWLWTETGFGPIEERVAPGKELLLFDAKDLCLNGNGIHGDGSSMDCFVGEDGAVYCVLEARLELMQDDYKAQMEQRMTDDPALASDIQDMLEADLHSREEINSDEDGVLTLEVPFVVTSYTDDDEQLYLGGEPGSITFQMKIR